MLKTDPKIELYMGQALEYMWDFIYTSEAGSAPSVNLKITCE